MLLTLAIVTVLDLSELVNRVSRYCRFCGRLWDERSAVGSGARRGTEPWQGNGNKIDEGTNTREYIPTIETRSSAVAGYILVAKELAGENSSRKRDRGRGRHGRRIDTGWRHRFDRGRAWPMLGGHTRPRQSVEDRRDPLRDTEGRQNGSHLHVLRGNEKTQLSTAGNRTGNVTANSARGLCNALRRETCRKQFRQGGYVDRWQLRFRLSGAIGPPWDATGDQLTQRQDCANILHRPGIGNLDNWRRFRGLDLTSYRPTALERGTRCTARRCRFLRWLRNDDRKRRSHAMEQSPSQVLTTLPTKARRWQRKRMKCADMVAGSTTFPRSWVLGGAVREELKAAQQARGFFGSAGTAYEALEYSTAETTHKVCTVSQTRTLGSRASWKGIGDTASMIGTTDVQGNLRTTSNPYPGLWKALYFRSPWDPSLPGSARASRHSDDGRSPHGYCFEGSAMTWLASFGRAYPRVCWAAVSRIHIVGSWTQIVKKNSEMSTASDEQNGLRHCWTDGEVIQEDVCQELLGQGFHRDKHVRSIKIPIRAWQWVENVLSVLSVHQIYGGDNERTQHRSYWTRGTTPLFDNTIQ